MFDKEAFKKYLRNLELFDEYTDFTQLAEDIKNGMNLEPEWYTGERYITNENKQECSNYIAILGAAQKKLNEKLAEADRALKECEELAYDHSLSFSMPRVSGVRFSEDDYGCIGWDRSDYSC